MVAASTDVAATRGWAHRIRADRLQLGVCETWVPLGPHRLGSRPSLASGSGLLEDQPTCH
jgi:hypothetical protein